MSAAAPGRLYGRMWRWHFFAALLVVPFVLWQSITGTVYLWHRELALTAHPELLTVVPGEHRTSYEAQLGEALARHADRPLAQIVVEDDPTRSTAFYFTAENGLSYPAFVDPYSGRYLGAVAPLGWLPGVSRSLHGGWPLGRWGSYLLELGACWAIVMIVTGIYLWWPRETRGFAGVLYPRLHAGSRIFWRDLHGTVGIYFALVVLAFLLTALPWTSFWGGEVLGGVQRLTHQVAPTSAFFGGGGHGHGANRGSAHAHERADLDVFVAAARQNGLRGRLEVRLGSDGARVQVRSQTGRAFNDAYLQLDRATGAVREHTRWNEMDAIPRFVAVGVDFHQGTFFGRANQLFNSLVAGGLVWLATTGVIGWYRRRPGARGLSPPPKRQTPLPRGLLVAGVALCVALPLFGLSVLCILLADLAIGRLLPARLGHDHAGSDAPG